jgi:phosphatidylserine/phosphatidylglycerophosphate/cardiolipin synthase-like enzyme
MRHKPYSLLSALLCAFALGVHFSPEVHRTFDGPGQKKAPETVLPPALHAPEPGAVEVRFSPDGGCTQTIVSAIRQAKTSIHLQAYSFTSAPIADALIQAHQKGVQIGVILDKSHRSERSSVAPRLHSAGIPLWIDPRHAIAHNKVIVVDRERVLTGSFNFTKAAEGSNAENLLSIRDPALASLYVQNWETHQSHSSPFIPEQAPKNQLPAELR